MRRSSFRYATVSAAACCPEAPTLPIGVLDELEVVFCEKARSGDVAAGKLLVKISERRSSLSDLNSPPGFSVNAVHASPQHQATSTARIEKVLAELKLETERLRNRRDRVHQPSLPGPNLLGVSGWGIKVWPRS
jgi:hypothetical protein